MVDAKIHIGNWVSFFYERERTLLFGFIVRRLPRTQNYVVFVPLKKRHYSVPLTIFEIEEQPLLLKEDIEALIDLTLDLRDEAWFQELTRKDLR